MADDAFASTVAAGLAATVAGPEATGATVAMGATLDLTTRPAVLPADARGELSAVTRGERYAKKRVLGAGGMGEVVLAEDRDIGRDVALKYLTAPANDRAALARFVDEIRVVGSLEHPNIVPIHDVGVDEQNRYYFVMKHVEGETLEHVIERLAAGDPAYHARFTYTARTEVFIALLRALAFAHARGYVHRDIKPANVMVGRFGEVVLMDWGVAKRCRAPELPPAEEADDARPVRERLYTTRRGAIVGTPAYMSPEQARGDVDAIDERSDLYCACVLFYELVALKHYLGERQTLVAMLEAIQREDTVLTFATLAHPAQELPPAEFKHLMAKGLQKDPAKRYQGANEVIAILEANLDGRCAVQCAFTAQKRMTRELSRFTDKHPVFAMATFVTGTLTFLGSFGWAVAHFLR